MKFLHKYYPELIVFGMILAILMIDLNPDFTFMNKGSDSIGYIYSAKYLYPSFHTSAPFYLLISHLFLMLPFGTDAWQMGLVSVFSTMGACIFLYLIIRKLTNNRLYSIIGILAYGTGALVISQSTIVETYALVAMCVVGAYYFAITKHWKLTALMLGMGMAVHLLGVIAFMLFLIFRDFRRNWRALLVSLSFVLFYLYIPLTNRPPYMWLPDPNQTSVFTFFTQDVSNIIATLIGTISIWDLPKRILDTIGIVWLSIGVITIVPLVYYFKVNGKKVWVNPLFWLAIIPIVLFISELDMQTYDYTMVGLPFLIIMACIGLKLMVERYHVKAQRLSYSILIIIIGLGIFNAYYFDLGVVEDPHMNTAELYHTEFAKIPDGAIFIPNNIGGDWSAIYLYNRENNEHIYPICIGMLNQDNYMAQLQKDGVKFIVSDNTNHSIAQAETAQSIIELNDNVWTSVITEPSTFGTEVVNANHDVDLIMMPDRVKIAQLDKQPEWKWIPDNPYDIITTTILISHWNYVTISQYNFSLFMFIFIIIYAFMVFIPKIGKKKVKDGQDNNNRREQGKTKIS
jgi:hypothetical protein